MIVGAIGGGAIGGGAGEVSGAAAGGALTAPIGGEGALPGAMAGGTIGTAMGAGFGAGALPEVIRGVIIDDMTHGRNSTWQDISTRSWGILKDTMVAGTIGAITGGAGRGAYVVAKGAAIPALRATEIATMAATGAATSAAFNGRVPTVEDFVVGVALCRAPTSL